MNRWKRSLSLLLTCALLLPACSAGGEELEAVSVPEKTVLVYATTDKKRVDRDSIRRFNNSHEDISIEVRDYSQADDMGRTGWNRLAVAILAGDIPDIIDLEGGIPYRQLALKGYLEDLWPYIDGDPDLGRASVMEAPLKAAEVDGRLCALFGWVYIDTLIGPERLVGDRTSWSLADLRAALAGMPEGAFVLPPFYTKDIIFTLIFSMSLDQYIDWDTGECHFDSEGFRAALEFVNSCPSDFDWSDTAAANEEMCALMESGLLLLNGMSIMDFDRVREYDKLYDALFGCGTSYIGLPVEDGSVGSSFAIHGRQLAMTSACKDKQAAWEYMRQLILPLRPETGFEIFPINRTNFEKMKNAAMNQRGGELSSYNNFSSMRFETTPLTEQEYERFMDFYNSIEKINLYDHTVFDIVQESCGAYFAGDKSLDDTVALVQNRVKLYVNEQR